MAETTTRAYTLKLQGDRLALWQNHVIFNEGVRAWGDWLLNLRGGLPSSLADAEKLLAVSATDVTKAAKEQAASITPEAIREEAAFRDATAKAIHAEVTRRKKRITEAVVRKDLITARRSELRRILAISWICPETPASLVPDFAIVARADDSDREAQVLSRFRHILRQKGIADEAGWLADCDATLRAHIRPDAVWIDRSSCFQRMPKDMRPTEAEAAQHVVQLFGSAKDYFATTTAAGDSDEKNYSTGAGNWVSKNWGEGKKSDDAQIIRSLRRLAEVEKRTVVGGSGAKALARLLAACDGKPGGDFSALCSEIGWRGKPNKTRIAIQRMTEASRVTAEQWERFQATADGEYRKRKATKGDAPPSWAAPLKIALSRTVGLPFKPADGRTHHFEYATMLAFAIRRVSQIHTKAKQAEAERQSFATEQRRRSRVPDGARQWLDAYVEARSSASGATDGYQLRRRALGGWPDVVAAWGSCKTAEDRVSAVRELQADWEKPGDVQLFEAIAADDARCVWQPTGKKGDASILTDYIHAAVADHSAVRFKVPAYRHPDPLRSPCFIGFGNSQWTISYSAQVEARKRQKLFAKAGASPRARAKADAAIDRAPVLEEVTLDLWEGGSMRPNRYRWQSRRLVNDLALHSIQTLEGVTVTRGSRFGRSRAGSGPVIVAGIADESPWNGRLQAPRRALEDIARLLDAKGLPYDDDSQWPPKIRSRLNHLGWFLTHSAKLTPSGPWLDYVAQSLPEDWKWAKGRDGHYLDREDNKDRKGRAKLILSRLPGLRVLSVDLGLRTSAAATVWQVVSQEELIAAKAEAKASESDLFCFIRRDNRTQVFRRVGPAAWARLDRQFLIRLDGEKAAARSATPSEWQAVQQLRGWLGSGIEVAPAKLPSVDRLQQEAARLCRVGLRRLADVTRVAFLLTAKERPITGGRMAPLDAEGQIEAAQDALAIWHGLVSSDDFSDSVLLDLWKTHVPDGPPLASRQTKKQRQETRSALRLAAERLRGNTALGRELAAIWRNRSADWVKHLRWLRDWVIPRFSKRMRSERVRAARDVGGLSLDRIATIRGVYQIMRAYASRPEPTNLRAGVERLEQEASRKLRPEFGRRMLAKMDRLRENRVKQIASRIVEAALGIGSEDRTHWEHGRRRPAVAIADPRFAPCHAIVIENLENYRPDEKRTRRENRGLMSWAARAVGKYLAEGCELHGIYLRPVSPSYTSRQDSRTGAPGLRCNDVPIEDLLNPDCWVGRLVIRGEEAAKEGKATPRQVLLVALADAARSGQLTSSTVRIIVPGGQLFVAANQNSPAASGIHADMNAAANIGLVALLDPDWPAAWWRLPCKTATGEVEESKVGGSEAVPYGRPLLDPEEEAARGIVNAWSDPQDGAIGRRTWTSSKRYWREVEERVVAVLRAWNLGGGRGSREGLPF